MTPAYKQLVSRLRETKSPGKGRQKVAPYKRRGSSARSVGFRSADHPPPEAGDYAEAMDLVEGERERSNPWIHHELNKCFKKLNLPETPHTTHNRKTYTNPGHEYMCAAHKLTKQNQPAAAPQRIIIDCAA